MLMIKNKINNNNNNNNIKSIKLLSQPQDFGL